MPTTLAIAVSAAMMLGESDRRRAGRQRRHETGRASGVKGGPDAPAEGVGVLLAELLKQDDAELAQVGVLAALLDDDGEPGGQVGRLLPDLRRLVVEPPEDRRDDLGQVRLDADAC
jgi:hypothetical protein